MRTKEQQEANDFDLHLFRLIERAGSMKDREPWRSIYWNLHGTRPLVRQMMHEDDRRETSANAETD